MMCATDLGEHRAARHQHDLWVVSDEVYGTLTFGKEHVSIGGLPGMASER
jgi:aspartate/methionine/tyrosine aminotransferase